jgi:L-iditol 2-dehydrogenase
MVTPPTGEQNMKRVVIHSPHHLELIDDPTPTAQRGEVLLAIKAVGICGSDLHVYEGQHPFVSYPVYPGHEVSGEIIAVGAGVDSALIGKRAVIEPSLPMGNLPRFEPGRYNIASDLKVMGFQTAGAMAHFFAVPQDRIHVLPQGFSHEWGATVEPTAVAVHGVRLAGNVAGMRVGVIGGGTIGLLVAQVAQAYGAIVTLTELDPTRRQIGESLGLASTPALQQGAYDIVFECVGIEATLKSAIFACCKGATIIVMGVFGKEVAVPVGLIQDWELRILGSLMYIGDDYREAIRLLGKGDVRVDPLITHRFALEQVHEAFAVALQRGANLKVMLLNT